MTKLINSGVYFHNNRHFPRISELFSVFVETPFFLSEGALRVGKAMTEV